jgi:alpha-glucoside transport system permease protein
MSLSTDEPVSNDQARWLAVAFLAPALILLAGILLYPMVYTVVRSLFRDDAGGTSGAFAGLANYSSIFTDAGTLRAVKNNVIWVPSRRPWSPSWA